MQRYSPQITLATDAGQEPRIGLSPAFSVAVDGGVAVLDTSIRNKCEVENNEGNLRRKRHSQATAKKIQVFNPTYAGPQLGCGQTLLVAERGCCGHRRRIVTYRCHRPTCAVCRNIRAKHLARTLGSALNRYQQQHGLYAYFLTLTFRNTETLRPYADMVNAVKRLFRMKVWKDAGLHGTVRSFENKVGSGSGLWHSHFHIVVLTERPIDTESGNIQALLSERWQKITGDSFRLDLRPFDGGYPEVFKYVVKDENDMTDGQLEEMVGWMHGHRFLALTGKLYANDELRRLASEEDEDELWASKEHCCPKCGVSDEIGGIVIHVHEWTGKKWDYAESVVPPSVDMGVNEFLRWNRNRTARLRPILADGGGMLSG